MSVQVLVRAGIMLASAAVITVGGGVAAVRAIAGDHTDPVRPVAMTAPPPARYVPPASGTTSPATTAPSVGDLAAETSVAAPTSNTGTATTTTLQALTSAGSRGGTATITLRGVVYETASKTPVTGRVTLWRKARSGRWTTLLANRATGPGGDVRLSVSQAGRAAVYRLTFQAAAPFAASTSTELTVRRR